MNYLNKPCLILFLLNIFLLGCTSKEVKKAKELINDGNYEQAIEYLELEVQDNPKNAEANFLLGKCYMETDDNDYEKIKQCFERAILVDSDYNEMIANIFMEKSLEFYKEGDDYKAKYYYKNCIVYNPTCKREFAQKLFDLTKLSDDLSTDAGRSMELFEIVDEISPEFKSQIAEKSYLLAKALINDGIIDQGFKYADFVIEHDPKRENDVAELYFGYGKELAEKLSKPFESIKYFRKYIKLSPDKKQELANFLNKLAKDFEIKNKIGFALFFGEKCIEYDERYRDWFSSLEQKYLKFTDERDGKVYKAVLIGTQLWMAENLSYKPGNGKYWAYDNNNANVAVYGYLYDWETAKIVCPAGWHLPSEAEWEQLEYYLGGKEAAGGKLKEEGTTHWKRNIGATNETGFTARAGGYRNYTDNYFGWFGRLCIWWSATDEFGKWNNGAHTYGVYDDGSYLSKNYNNKKDGYYIRCLKD